MERGISVLGTLALLLIAFFMSNNKKKIDFKLVIWGVGLQTLFAVLILKTDAGRELFAFFNDVICGLLDLAQKGAGFVFGGLINNTVPIGTGFVGDAPLQAVQPNTVAYTGAMFAFKVLPTIIFFSSLMAVLYHLGIMQKIVSVVARCMAFTMKTSGSESLSAAANIFVGQTEAPLVIKPYLKKMTNSELMAIMTGGMATVAGGVMAAYVAMLKDYFPNIAGHLMAASIMSAPAALIIAKIMIPETEVSETKGVIKTNMEKLDPNVIGAAARGAGEGLQLALNVGGMLMAFIALVALGDKMIGLTGHAASYLKGMDPYGMYVRTSDIKKPLLIGDYITVKKVPEKGDMKLKITSVDNKGDRTLLGFTSNTAVYENHKNLSFVIDGKTKKVKKGEKEEPGSNPVIQKGTGKDLQFAGAFQWSLAAIFGFVFAPLAFLMGVPWVDCKFIGYLFGEKIVLNEFVAYGHLGQVLASGKVVLQERSIIIATYALCGFANFSSIAIQIGGIGAIAPSRKADLAKLGMKSMIAGALAAFMTATIAGMII
ncbi:hypothetical protein KAJ27_00840 [bacterium]|nr:hypothetical protein [bacterium]